MCVHIPAQVARRCFVNNRGYGRKVRGDVVFKSVLADIVKKLLQSGDLHDARATKRFEGIVGKSSATGVATDVSVNIIRGKSGKAHGAGLDTSNTGAKRIFLADSAGDDFLEIHLHVFEEMFGQVAAMKTNSLVRINAIVVI